MAVSAPELQYMGALTQSVGEDGKFSIAKAGASHDGMRSVAVFRLLIGETDWGI